MTAGDDTRGDGRYRAGAELPYTPLRHTCIVSVTTTTIRVDKLIRDRLAALAEAHGRSLGDELAAVLDDLAWQDIEEGYRRLSANEASIAAYRAESDRWLSVDLDALASGVHDEYPEYNGAGG
jgi:hypothetical protein